MDLFNKIFDLTERWEDSTSALYDEEFETEAFGTLAAETFALLFPYHAAESLPRELLGLLFKIKEFACCPATESPEGEAAQLVAHEFCNQMEDCWVQIDGTFDQERFAVANNLGEDVILDAHTFDLTELM